jgi:hypothetical protein
MTRKRFAPVNFSLQKGLFERTPSDALFPNDEDASPFVDAVGRIVSGPTLKEALSFHHVEMLMRKIRLNEWEYCYDLLHFLIEKWSSSMAGHCATSPSAPFQIAGEAGGRNKVINEESGHGLHKSSKNTLKV